MCRFEIISSNRPWTLAILLLATLLVSSAPAGAQASGTTEIEVEVSLDPSKSGMERCRVEPEDLVIPRGVADVTWSLATGPGTSTEGSAMQIESVDFESSLPVTANERLGPRSWRAVFDCEDPFPKMEYHVHVREADGTVTECYPHVAGSTDQGGGG